MPRRSHGSRPYHNATSLYGWGYNGSAGPGVQQVSAISKPSELGWESYGQSQRESFWDYCYQATAPGSSPNIMGENSEGPHNYGDVIFGGLGIGVDFPLYLGHEYSVGNVAQDGYLQGTPNPFVARLQSHVPLPVRLDDYDSSGNRIGRENWVKIQGGIADCLGIKTSGSTVRSSGNLYGWGLGEYNGGPAHHASMRYWSCVPEVIDSGSDRFYVDSLGYGYFTDSAGHIADETAKNEHMSRDWTDIASMNRHRSTETDFAGNSWYAGIKNGNLYTWGYKPLGKGKSLQNLLYHKISRVYYAFGSSNSGPWTGSPVDPEPLESNGNISGIQPTYTKVFGGNNNFAAIDSDGMLYFAGEMSRIKKSSSDISTATAYYPTKLSTTDGQTGFSWYDSNYYDMTVIQNGKIFYAEPLSNLADKHSLHGDLSSIFTELDDATSTGNGWAGTSGWTQAYGLVSSQYHANEPAVVALNASGQIWFRAWSLGSQPTPLHRYEILSSNPDLSIEPNKWSKLSPDGVAFTKIILNPNRSPYGAYQIMGLTDKGEIYTTDNTYGQIFPYVDPVETGRGAPATHDGNTCPYSAGYYNHAAYSPTELLKWINMRNWEPYPSGFFKIKPLTDGGTGVEWDQQKHQCTSRIGWPVNHPTWKTRQEGVPGGGGDGTASSTYGVGNTYSWGLEYRVVDGNDTLRYLPVKDRENNAGDRYSWLADRYSPVLEYTGQHIDTTDDNPNVRNGSTTFGYDYVQYGDFTASVNYGLSDDNFGASLATNEDGTIMAVSSRHHDNKKGKVTVYRLIDGSWTQMGSTLDADYGASAGSANDYYGHSVGLSKHSLDLGDDLNDLTIAIGCPGGTSGRGEVYIYRWYTATSNWVIKGVSSHPIVGSADTGEGRDPEFGFSLDLSSDGSALVVGAPYFDAASPAPSQARIDGGKVYVFTWGGSSWSQKGSAIQSANWESSKGGGKCYSNAELQTGSPRFEIGSYKHANFGFSVAINEDADTVAVGSPSDYHEDTWDSKRLGQVQFFQFNIPGTSDWTHRHTQYSGYGGVWAQLGNCRGYGNGYKFGASVALSDDGHTVVIGEVFGNPHTTGRQTGLAQAGDRSWSSTTEVYDWKPPRGIHSGFGGFMTLKHPDTSSATSRDKTHMGYSVAISRDGKYIAVGSPNSNPLQERGCVHLFQRGQTWYRSFSYVTSFENQDYAELGGKSTGELGYSVAISKDGKVIFGSATSLSADPDHTRSNQVFSGSDARWMAWKYGEDRSTATFSFKHPRRGLSRDRDFLWDGQDMHSFTDGWEDLTVCRWLPGVLFNKYWGIR